MATPAELDAWLQTQWKAVTRDGAAADTRLRMKVQVEQLQTRLKTYQELKEQDLRLQHDMKKALRGLLETCRALKGSPVKHAKELKRAAAASR
jgi:hypothetical protein